jgi:hypothetical protein
MMSMGRVASRSTSILPRPSLDAHLLGQTEGYVFEGRDQGHISTRQIQRLLDEAAENAGIQCETAKDDYSAPAEAQVAREACPSWSWRSPTGTPLSRLHTAKLCLSR